MRLMATESSFGTMLRGKRSGATKRRDGRRRSAGCDSRRAAPRLECLETRALRSSVPLSGFPAGGFRSNVLDGSGPWDVAIVVDGAPTFAIGFDESDERISDAPGLLLTGEDSLWIAGIIGDTRLRGSDAATNDVDLYRIDLPSGPRYSLRMRALAQ